FGEWEANDYQVMSWFFNSMEPQVYEIFAYSETSKALWDSLRDMYGHDDNDSRVFELQQEISKMEQTTGQSFIHHLRNLKRKWDELKQYRPIAATVEVYTQREEQDRMFQLLASLTLEYEDLRRQILMQSTLPSWASVYATVNREETRRHTMNISVPSSNKFETDNPENSFHNVVGLCHPVNCLNMCYFDD
ncbi:UBN2_3 domain-containing protein, partial [Cephalotus follicularis]